MLWQLKWSVVSSAVLSVVNCFPTDSEPRMYAHNVHCIV